MVPVKKLASEAAATAPKASHVAPEKPTLDHSPTERCFATPCNAESENSLIGRPIHEFRKAGGYIVRVQVETFKGTTYLDIRQWTQRGGEPSRTGKGITIPLERVGELGEALCRAQLLAEPKRT